MHKSMILELVANGTNYYEKINAFKNEEYGQRYKEFEEFCENLCKDMPEKEKFKTLWDLSLAQGGIEAITADEYFKAGFKLGLIIGAQNFLD